MTAAPSQHIHSAPDGHGNIVKRFGVIAHDGKPDTKAIRPLQHDPVFPIPGSCEPQVSGRIQEICELYRSVFSRHLLEDATVLRPDKRLTLEPLRTGLENLATPDGKRNNAAALPNLHLHRMEGTNMNIHRADGVFSEMEDRRHAYDLWVSI